MGYTKHASRLADTAGLTLVSRLHPGGGGAVIGSTIFLLKKFANRRGVGQLQRKNAVFRRQSSSSHQPPNLKSMQCSNYGLNAIVSRAGTSHLSPRLTTVNPRVVTTPGTCPMGAPLNERVDETEPNLPELSGTTTTLARPEGIFHTALNARIPTDVLLPRSHISRKTSFPRCERT